MHDGMNVFFSEFASTGQTWEVAESIESGLIKADPLVIAVWGEGGTQKFNPRRINEFLVDDLFEARPELWETLEPILAPPTREPRGNFMIELVCDEVLPAVAKRFGLELDPRRTAIAGCSVAGIAAINTAARHPDVFGTALSFSSHWQFGGEALVQYLAGLVALRKNLCIWADSGTEGLDAGSAELNELFGEALAGWSLREGIDFTAPIFGGTGHSETFWAKRLPTAVNWWLDRQIF
jgi:hypothetical protein